MKEFAQGVRSSLHGHCKSRRMRASCYVIDLGLAWQPRASRL